MVSSVLEFLFIRSLYFKVGSGLFIFLGATACAAREIRLDYGIERFMKVGTLVLETNIN